MAKQPIVEQRPSYCDLVVLEEHRSSAEENSPISINNCSRNSFENNLVISETSLWRQKPRKSGRSAKRTGLFLKSPSVRWSGFTRITKSTNSIKTNAKDAGTQTKHESANARFCELSFRDDTIDVDKCPDYKKKKELSRVMKKVQIQGPYSLSGDMEDIIFLTEMEMMTCERLNRLAWNSSLRRVNFQVKSYLDKTSKYLSIGEGNGDAEVHSESRSVFHVIPELRNHTASTYECEESQRNPTQFTSRKKVDDPFSTRRCRTTTKQDRDDSLSTDSLDYPAGTSPCKSEALRNLQYKTSRCNHTSLKNQNKDGQCFMPWLEKHRGETALTDSATYCMDGSSGFQSVPGSVSLTENVSYVTPSRAHPAPFSTLPKSKNVQISRISMGCPAMTKSLKFQQNVQHPEQQNVRNNRSKTEVSEKKSVKRYAKSSQWLFNRAMKAQPKTYVQLQKVYRIPEAYKLKRICKELRPRGRKEDRRINRRYGSLTNKLTIKYSVSEPANIHWLTSSPKLTRNQDSLSYSPGHAQQKRLSSTSVHGSKYTVLERRCCCFMMHQKNQPWTIQESISQPSFNLKYSLRKRITSTAHTSISDINHERPRTTLAIASHSDRVMRSSSQSCSSSKRLIPPSNKTDSSSMSSVDSTTLQRYKSHVDLRSPVSRERRSQFCSTPRMNSLRTKPPLCFSPIPLSPRNSEMHAIKSSLENSLNLSTSISSSSTSRSSRSPLPIKRIVMPDFKRKPTIENPPKSLMLSSDRLLFHGRPSKMYSIHLLEKCKSVHHVQFKTEMELHTKNSNERHHSMKETTNRAANVTSTIFRNWSHPVDIMLSNTKKSKIPQASCRPFHVIPEGMEFHIFNICRSYKQMLPRSYRYSKLHGQAGEEIPPECVQ